MFRGGLEEILLSILAILIILIFIGCLYAFFRAIFLFVFSEGKEDKITKAWNSIRYMVLGIVFTIAILFLFPVILSKANFVGYETFNAQSIFNQATKIARAVLNFGKDAATTYEQSRPRTTTPTSDPTPVPPTNYDDLEL